MRRRLLRSLFLLGVLLASPSGAVAAAPAFDLRGTWEVSAAAGALSGTITWATEDCTTGAIAGSISSAGKSYPAAGTIDGAAITFTAGPFSNDAADVAHASGTAVDGGRIVGTYTDNDAHKITPAEFQMQRTGGQPMDGKGCGAKHPVAMTVRCDYTVATALDTCTAVVRDAGVLATTVTGTVRFAAPSGVFLGGEVCTLAITVREPSSSSCSVPYRSPTGPKVYPDITATYSGDAEHAASSAVTTYVALSGPLEYEVPAPGTLALATTVPVDATKLDACVLVASGARAARMAPAGPEAIRAETPTERFARLMREMRVRLKSMVIGSLPMWASAEKDVQEKLDQAIESVVQLRSEAAPLASSASASEQERAAELLRKANEMSALMSKLIEQRNRQCRSAIQGIRSGAPMASSARASGRIVRIARARVAGAKAGPLTLTLKLDRSALRRAAGSSKQVTVYVRVTQVLPSSARKAGWQRSTLQRIRLTRSGARIG